MPWVCEYCRRAELTPRERFKEDARAWFTQNFSRQYTPFNYTSTAISAMLGSTLIKSAYEMHRDEFIRTGDDQELTRMLRHL